LKADYDERFYIDYDLMSIVRLKGSNDFWNQSENDLELSVSSIAAAKQFT